MIVDDPVVSTLNEHAEPPGVWLRRLFLWYASRNTERSLSALSLQSYQRLVRDMAVASRLDAMAGVVLYNTVSREDRRMDYAGFAESLVLLSRRLYPDLDQRDAFSALLERDVLPRTGSRASPPEPVDGCMAASMRLLESLGAPLYNVWLGYCMRPGLSFHPRSRENRASAVQAQMLVGTRRPGQHADGPDPEAEGDEGMPLESFLHFCADAGIAPTSSHGSLSEVFVQSLEGSYDPWVADGKWQPVLSFKAFQVALVRTAMHVWASRAHTDVRSEAWPRPLKALFTQILLYTRWREQSHSLGKLRTRARLGLEHEQMLLDGWHALLHRIQLVWEKDGHPEYFEMPPAHTPSGLELIGVHAPDSPLRKTSGYSPLQLGTRGRALSPQLSWPDSASALRAAARVDSSSLVHATVAEGGPSSLVHATVARATAAEGGDDEGDDAPADAASLRRALGADLNRSLSASREREQTPVPRPHTPLHADALGDATTGAHSPPCARALPPPDRACTPRLRSPERQACTPGAAGAASAHSPPYDRGGARRPLLLPPSPSAVPHGGGGGHAAVVSPSFASARSTRHSQDGEQAAAWTSPRAATYGTMPWEVASSWPPAADRPPRTHDGEPRTTAEALAATSTGSYTVASRRHAQLAAQHQRRWQFHTVELRLHEAQLGQERRAEQRARELEGNRLRSPAVPRTPKQWIGLDTQNVTRCG